MKRADRRRRTLERREGNRSGRRVLIVCEGQTEGRYFKEFKKLLRSSGVDVEVVDDAGSAPISVVNHALDQYDRAEKDGEPFDSVYEIAR